MSNKTCSYLAFLLGLLCASLSIHAQCIDFPAIEDKIINLGDLVKKDSIAYQKVFRGALLEGNEDFSSFAPIKTLLEDVEIVLLGEQSHGEGTVYDTKVKLIKYLHQELGFDLIVVESGFYDCKKAWELIEQGQDVKLSLSQGIFPIWSYTKEVEMLFHYIEESKATTKPLTFLGFDSQFSNKISEKYYLEDLKTVITSIDSSLVNTKEWKHLTTSVQSLFKYDKKVKKKEVHGDTLFINQLIAQLHKASPNQQTAYWIQALKSTKVSLSDFALKSDFRDQQMAENLIWIKKQYPDKKIICWGATSHFLYKCDEITIKNPIVKLLVGPYYKNNRMMGQYLKEEYGNKVYSIGFTTYEGTYGLFSNTKIKAAKEGSLEYVLNQAPYDNFLLPLRHLSFNRCPSRPLGNIYTKNDIANQMDAVIFNRKIKRPWFNAFLFIKMNPDHFYTLKMQKENPAVFGTPAPQETSE